MPTYEYYHPETGETYEEMRRISARDLPASRPGFVRRDVPSRVFGVTGGGSDCPAEGIVSYERAMKHYENSGDMARTQRTGEITVKPSAMKEYHRRWRQKQDALRARRGFLAGSSDAFVIKESTPQPG